jgi:hypothetical protein
MQSNDITQLQSRPDGDVALAGECTVVHAKEAFGGFREFTAFETSRPSAVSRGLPNGSGNRNGQLLDGGAANEMCCGNECGILILIENRVGGHAEQRFCKGSQRPVCFLPCSLNESVAASGLYLIPLPLGE